MAGTIPGSVLQFMSVAVPVLINIILFAILSALFVMGKYPQVVAPLDPEGEIGSTKGFCSWLFAFGRLTEKDIKGGLDAVLTYKRVKLRACMTFVWTLIGIPVAVVYSLSLVGGSTEGGFDRITFSNVNIVRKNDGVQRYGDVWWRNIALVVGAYLVPLLSLPILDRYDEEACECMLEEAKEAPAQHYAVVLTGIEEESRDPLTLKNFFESALGLGAVVKVQMIKDLSALPEGVVDDEEEKSSMSIPLPVSLGGIRERQSALVAALKAAKRADLALENSKGKESMVKLTKSPEEAKIDARKLVEKKRQALIRAANIEAPNTAAAVVVLDSVARATSAATAPLGIRNSWVVTPAPEPRQVLWTNLEGLSADRVTIDSKEQAGSRIKTSIYIFWSMILIGLTWVATYILRIAEAKLSGGAKAIVTLVSGMVPALVASIMMSLVATILRAINSATRFDCWNEAALQIATARDFVFFLQMIGFIVPLLGSSLINGIQDMGGQPLRIFTLIAINVPSTAYYFAMLVLVKMAGFINATTRFVPYVLYRIFTYLAKTDLEKELVAKPGSANFAPFLGWESFTFLVACVYAPVAPYATAIAWVYLSLAAPCVKLDLAAITKTPFVTHGSLWRLTVRQTLQIMSTSTAIHCGILLFSGNFIHFVCLLPVILVHTFYRGKMEHRYNQNSIHGKAKGRLPLLEASDIDKARPKHLVADLDASVEKFKLYSPQCAVDNDVLPGAPLADDEDIEIRQRAILAWEKRYDAPEKMPQTGGAAPSAAVLAKDDDSKTATKEIEMA